MLTTDSFYELLQYKRFAVTYFTNFLLTPEESVRDKFSPKFLKHKIRALINQELAHMPMLIPMVQWQVGNTVLAVHSYNVSSIALLIGAGAGLNENELEELMTAAIFHDVGKNFIANHIIDKLGPLSPTEKYVVNQHPNTGKFFLENHYPEFGDAVIDAVWMHHEKLDGSGYYGFSKDQIGQYARIIAVADILCAICEERTYHPARTMDESFQMLRQTQGLDQRYVDVYKTMAEAHQHSVMELVPISTPIEPSIILPEGVQNG